MKEAEKMLRQMNAKVDTVAHSHPVTVSADDPLRAAATRLWQHDIGVLVVMQDERAVGVLSERDVVSQIAQGHDPDTVTAGQTMTPCVMSARPDDPLSDSAVRMLEAGVRHLPVVDDHNHLTGMLSIRDLLRPLLMDALGRPDQDFA